MKKKFAYMLMGEDYDTSLHKAEFETENQITYIKTVRNLDEACEKAIELKNDGVGVIELCGAFGKLGADKIIKVTDNKVGIGYVINSEDQSSLFNRFFVESKK